MDQGVRLGDALGPDNATFGLGYRGTVRMAAGDLPGAADDCWRGLAPGATAPFPIMALLELGALVLASAGSVDDAVAALAAGQILRQETGHGGRPWQREHRAAATELAVQALGAAAFEARLAEHRRQPVAQLRRRICDALGPIAAEEARGL